MRLVESVFEGTEKGLEGEQSLDAELTEHDGSTGIGKVLSPLQDRLPGAGESDADVARLVAPPFDEASGFEVEEDTMNELSAHACVPGDGGGPGVSLASDDEEHFVFARRDAEKSEGLLRLSAVAAVELRHP